MTRGTQEDKKGNSKSRGRPAAPVIDEAKTQPQPKYESGRDAFMHIATGRVNGILEKLGTLAKLASGKSRYGYTDGEIEYIRKTLIEGVNSACDRLRRKPVKGDFSFHGSPDAGA